MIKTRQLYCLLGSGLLLTGCVTAPKSLYSWGSYQDQVYKMYSSPEKFNPADQITTLEKEIEIAKSKNGAVPPGLYAHIGYLHLQTADNQKAAQYFELEKQAYPEVTVFMSRLLKGLTTERSQ